MRSLYWKIFISFWLATILIILTTAWAISHIAQKSSQPAREELFMDSYANAAVVTFESGQRSALLKWLEKIGLSRHMSLYLLTSKGEIIGAQTPPEEIKEISKNLIRDELPSDGIFKSGKISVSHEILSTTGTFYRLAAVSDKPISFFVQIPWAGLSIRLILATFFSGLICYLLSLYLTKPLRSLGMAAKSIATGKLSTRVGPLRGHNKDEIAELSTEFDRMAEQLEQLIGAKERLLQDISHELRSPLARLNIAIELARNKTNHAADKEFSRMELESKRLNALIGEILEFARLDKSTTEIDLERINVAELLYELIKDANYEFGRGAERIIIECIEPCQLYFDKRLIHRALENIIRNALHYSPEDQSVFIALSYSEDKKYIHIKIQDKGPGVPDEQLEKIFDAFYRVDTSRTKKTGGYGLGLAIAARAILLHQGTVTAQNNKQGGLCVHVRLPIDLEKKMQTDTTRSHS